MAFGDVIQQADGASSDSITLPLPVAAGNTLVLIGRFRTFEGGLPTSVSDSVNAGDYQSVIAVGEATNTLRLGFFAFPNISAGSPVITTTGTTAYRWLLVELQGALSSKISSGAGSNEAGGTTFTTASAEMPSGSISLGATIGAYDTSNFSPSAPWVQLVDGSAGNELHKRVNTTTETDNLSGTVSSSGFSVTPYSAAWASFTEAAVVPTLRKGSQFTVEETLAGTVTSATLNGNAITVDSHVGTTVTLTDTGSGITTSGEYPLVLTDDTAATETITVQVNVYGVAPSNNPLQKDGAALASLTGVQVRITDGENINGTELYYSGTATTDASGNLASIDLSSTAVVDADPVLLHMRTAAGDSIIASETVGLI